ncbi:hypothetical protein K466DRAFT_659668 [Polyporus arcularius HHB13444]|uniref:DUF6534 domain-containing protein n=1 Tax=Polyporus arcularius HHB13444 TaxID=1314778 RepID=A0A5C3PQB6_9APHY|nr:hypothetical protein K466DRAFT_659668 [Polyporus arcularius HHB13444]
MANDPSQPAVSGPTLFLIGPILVGALLSFLLFGISIVQLYIYHANFPRDRSALRVSVYAIFALDILQSVLAGAEAWDTLCAGWGRPINLRYPNWSFYFLPMLSGVVASWVQIFYAWRIFRLGQWKVVPGLIIFMSLVQTGAASAIAVSFTILKDIERLHDKNMYARTIIWLGGGVFTDLTVMFSMVYMLYSVKRNSPAGAIRRSELMINRLLRVTVETGLACAVAATLELVLFLALPDTNMHFIVALVLSKVYSNTLMVSLNSRIRINEPSTDRKTYSAIGFNAFPTLETSSDATPRPPLAVHISPTRVRGIGPLADKQSTDWDVELTELKSPGAAGPASESDLGQSAKCGPVGGANSNTELTLYQF